MLLNVLQAWEKTGANWIGGWNALGKKAFNRIKNTMEVWGVGEREDIIKSNNARQKGKN